MVGKPGKSKIQLRLMLAFSPWQVRWKRWKLLACVLASYSFFCAYSAAASPQPGAGEFLFHQSNSGEQSPGLLLDTDYRTHVAGMVADTTLTQVFRNTTGDWQEGTYVFPLPETAAAYAMELRLGDRVIRSRIHERMDAKRIYKAARDAGKVAGLTEQSRPNLFTQSVANIPPGTEIQVTIRFIQTIDYIDGRFELRLPMTLTPRYIPGTHVDAPVMRTGWSPPTSQVPDAPAITPFMVPGEQVDHKASIEITLEPGLPLASIDSRYHKVTKREEGNLHMVKLADRRVAMNRDFVLDWRPTPASAPRAAFFGQHKNGYDYGLLMVMPPTVKAQASLPREFIFVVDTSGSMKGTSIRQARLALEDALSWLEAGDRFNIIAFNSDYSALFDEPRYASQANLAAANDFIIDLEADGGTEMAGALQAALSAPPQESWLRQVIFITDGAVGNETALFRLIHQHLGKTRLFTVGIGSAPNSFFMRKAAQFGRGTFVHIGATSEVRERIGALLARIGQPAARAIKIDWGGSSQVDYYPRRLPALYGSEPLVVLARSRYLQGGASVSGQRRDDAWQQQVAMNIDDTAGGIDMLWARAGIAALLDDKVMGADPSDIRKKVTRLGLEHRLVTPYTSFVAVEQSVSRMPGQSGLAHQAVANQVASGQQVAAVMLPGTATRSALSMLVGSTLLLLAFGQRWLAVRIG